MSEAQPGPPGIVARWRRREDELQVNQAIAVVCQDPAVASAFVRDILEIASSDGESGPRAAAALNNLPMLLRCSDQSHLPEQRRRAVLRERRHAGIADLDFWDDDGDFRLIVELKINADRRSIGDGRTQLDSYLRVSPVVAIARKPLDPPVEALDKWLGTVRWKQLGSRLERLPIVDESLRSQWLELLTQMRDDGDFEEEPPKTSQTTQEAARWLETNKAALRTALADATSASPANGHRQQDRMSFATAITPSRVSCGRDVAAIAFRLPHRPKRAVAGPIWIEIVPAHVPTPKATVIWWPPLLPYRWKRAAREADASAHSKLEASRFISHPINESYRFTANTPVALVRDAGLDALLPELVGALAAMGHSGVLKPCLDDWLGK